MSDNTRQGLKWEDWQIFADEGTKLAIKVTRAEGEGGRAFFSCQVGRMKAGYDSEVFSPFIPPRIKVDGLRVEAALPAMEVLSTLQDQAEAAIEHHLAQARADAAFERETAAEARSKPKPRPGLKSLAKADAARRGGGRG